MFSNQTMGIRNSGHEICVHRLVRPRLNHNLGSPWGSTTGAPMTILDPITGELVTISLPRPRPQTGPR
ncbi:protein of unassigned function [Methylobacterium oryzae CBMB20]|uniref:Protein of unassigned function n=1 Tax=Methylobacterium oryzae CBMB20 TaxID=693986 RepID=A0A089NNR1_9HYPH|nr:protein of unassigned function [Methylobacterium oryzae CBMB20]